MGFADLGGGGASVKCPVCSGNGTIPDSLNKHKTCPGCSGACNVGESDYGSVLQRFLNAGIKSPAILEEKRKRINRLKEELKSLEKDLED